MAWEGMPKCPACGGNFCNCSWDAKSRARHGSGFNYQECPVRYYDEQCNICLLVSKRASAREFQCQHEDTAIHRILTEKVSEFQKLDQRESWIPVALEKAKSELDAFSAELPTDSEATAAQALVLRELTMKLQLLEKRKAEVWKTWGTLKGEIELLRQALQENPL